LQIARVALFLAASLVSVSRQRSREVGKADARLQALFDTTLDAIIFADSSGRFIDANPAATALLGYSHREIMERSIGDLSSSESQGREAKAIFHSVVTKGTASGETVIRRKDGEIRQVEYRCIGNALPGVHFVVMHDVTESREAQRSMQQLSGRLLHLLDEERRRFARQLHDTIAQSLAAIRLNLAVVSRSPAVSSGAIKEAVEESVALTEQSIAEIRTLSYLLHPPMIDEAGLLPSLQWYARGFEQRSGITTTFDAPPEMDRLPRELETAVFRIVQEALSNIQRHSGSAVAGIRLERLPQGLQLEVRDEGRGIPAEFRDHHSALIASGVGIAGIEHRVRELGGKMEIESSDRGTRIAVTLPIPET
jgi:PAS domain S-box-containing protein